MSETLGDRISKLLKKNGMTQRGLAEAIGVTEVSVGRYINGHRIPKGFTIVNIAAALHTTTDYLLGRKIDDNQATQKTVKSILKPCPFCGREDGVYMCKEGNQWQVICDYGWGGCGASSGFYDTPKETAEAWNRRAGEVEK